MKTCKIYGWELFRRIPVILVGTPDLTSASDEPET
jgi:hypothetical protein